MHLYETHLPVADIQRSPELLANIEKLNARGVPTLNLAGQPTQEPSVFGWMPAASIGFRDPDGHLLEYLAILPDPPPPDFIGRYSDWKKRQPPEAASK